MAFIEEHPSAQDIEDFELPFWTDLEKPIEYRRTWLADRERDVYLAYVGVTGNQAFDDNIKQDVGFYLGRTRFNVILEPREGSISNWESPYVVHYPVLLKIMVYVSPELGMIDVLPEVSRVPDEPHQFLKNRSLKDFVALLKESLVTWKAGRSNKFIQGTITVSFGF